MEDAIETYEHRGLTISLYYDLDAERPFSDTVTILGNFNIADQCAEIYPGDHAQEYQDEFDQDGDVAVPIVSSGDSIAICGIEDANGFAFIPARVFVREWAGMIANNPVAALADAHANIRNYIDGMDSYLNGDVYGFTVDDADGEQIDGCWGFIGDINYVRTEAEASAEHYASVA